MDNTWIWLSIGAMIGYYFGLYVGLKHKPKNEIESQIQWQHAYNLGYDRGVIDERETALWKQIEESEKEENNTSHNFKSKTNHAIRNRK